MTTIPTTAAPKAETFSDVEVAHIAIGTLIAHGINGRFSRPTPVVEIFARGTNRHGRPFVCGYREYGDNARISFSIAAGDITDAAHYRISL